MYPASSLVTDIRGKTAFLVRLSRVCVALNLAFVSRSLGAYVVPRVARKCHSLFVDSLGAYFVVAMRTMANYTGQEEVIPYKLDGRQADGGAPLHALISIGCHAVVNLAVI